MITLNKLVLAFLAMTLLFALFLSLGVRYYKAKFEESQRAVIIKTMEQKDSTRRVEYIHWKNIQEKELEEFSDSLIIIHKKTIAAEKVALQARVKADKAHEDRKLIHLHPDSLQTF